MQISNFFKKHNYVIPTDLLFLIYFIFLSLLIIIFKSNVPHWHIFILQHLFLFLAAAFFLEKAHFSKHKLIKILRFFYPFFIFALLYKNLSNLAHLIWLEHFDPYITKFEMHIYNQHLTVLLQSIASRPLTEILSFAYLSHYIIAIFPSIYFYFTDKMKLFNEYMEAITITLLVCFTIFILFPVQGPRFELANQYSICHIGYFIYPIQAWIENYLRGHVSNFPSMHVAITYTSWIIIYRHLKKLSWYLLPLLILLCFATVYFRYNYLSDVVSAIITSWIALYLRDIYNEYFNRKKYSFD